MSIKPEALSATLKKGIPAVTWIHGNEPLLVIEASDAVRAAARKAGFDERIVLPVDRNFNSGEITEHVNAMSLFASKKLIEVRFPAKPNKETGNLIGELATQGIPDDIRLLISSERPDPALLRGAVFKAIDSAGLSVEIFPIDHSRLPNWIADRLRAQEQQADRELLQTIAQRVEGNLLAADQEIRKLKLLFEPGQLPTQEATAAILEVARYDAQDLTDAVLGGDVGRTIRSLDGLAAEGRADALVVWHLAEAARAMLRIQDAMATGAPMRPVLAQCRAFGPRQRLFEQAARRLDSRTARKALTDAAQADTMAKGFRPGDSWRLIRQIALDLAGVPQPALPA